MAGTAPARTERKDKADDRSSIEMDPGHLDMICNPAYHAFKAGLKAFHESPSNEIIGQLHTILLLDGSQQHAQIQRLVPELYPYITRAELYDRLALLFSDISHLNGAICDTMLEFGIFDKLDFDREISFSLVLNLCDANTAAWAMFSKSHMQNSRVASHPKIRLLAGQYKQGNAEHALPSS